MSFKEFYIWFQQSVSEQHRYSIWLTRVSNEGKDLVDYYFAEVLPKWESLISKVEQRLKGETNDKKKVSASNSKNRR